MTEITEQKGYTHKFLWQFLLPKYWSIWLGVLVLLILAFVPYLLRDKLAVFVGKVACRYLKKKGNKQFRRSDINLRYCFPDWNEDKRLKTIEEMFITVAQTMLGIGEIAVRSVKHLQKRSEFIGLEHIYQAKAEGKNIILLVPHTWAIDASGIILHTYRMPMVSMRSTRLTIPIWARRALRSSFHLIIY